MAIKLKNLRKLTGSNHLLTLFLFLTVILLGFVVVWLYGGTQLHTGLPAQPLPQNPKKVEEDKSISGCEYGWDSIYDYLEKYVVRSGDTLLSIAKNEMGDVSRYQELIDINEQTYPHLATYNSFLEVGMTLHIPPIEWGATAGHFLVPRGEILKIEKNRYFIDSLDRMDSRFTSNSFIVDERTIYKDKKDYKAGDCVVMVYTSGENLSRAIMIFTQQPTSK